MRKILTLIAALAISATMLVTPAIAANPPASSAQVGVAHSDLVRDSAFGAGRIFLVGKFTRARPAGDAAGSANEVVRFNVAALNSRTGVLIPGWNPKVNGQVFAVAFSRGRVYIGGQFTRVRGKPRKNLAALNAVTGALIPSWKPTTNAVVRELTVGAGGSIYAGGAFTRVDGRVRNHIALIGRSGGLGAFAPNIGQIGGQGCPPRCAPVVYSIALSPNGRTVYFGGHFGKVNGANRNEAAAVTTAGRLLRWNPNIFAKKNCATCTPLETHRVYTMIPTRNRVYICGGFWKVWGTRVTSFNVLVTNTTTGAPLPKFGIGTDGDTPGCALKGNVLYLGGHFQYVGRGCSQNPPPGQHSRGCTGTDPSNVKTCAPSCVRRLHVAAINVKSGRVLSFNPTPNSDSGVWSVTAGPPGLVFGGYFWRFGGADQQGVARYAGNPAA